MSHDESSPAMPSPSDDDANVDGTGEGAVPVRAEGKRKLTVAELAQFDALVVATQSELRLAARKFIGPLLRTRVEEEDVVQETLLKVQACLENGHHHVLLDSSQFIGLSYKVLQNHLHDLRSRHTRKCRDVATEVPLHESSTSHELGTASTMSPSRTLARKERAHAVRAAVSGLAPLDREIVTQHLVDNASFADVGRQTNLSADAVRKRFMRICARLEGAFRALTDQLRRRPPQPLKDRRSADPDP